MSAQLPQPEVKISVYGVTDVGAVRKNNEDSFLIADLSTGRAGAEPEVLAHTVGERGTLLLVSDGMGGAEAGEVASRLVAQNVSIELGSMPLAFSPKEAIREAVERANRAVWKEANANSARKGMGATLAAAWIRGREAFIVGVGDSRVYLLRSARIRQITRDQSMVESMVEAHVITREEAENHPQKNMILQAMGVSPEVVVALERIDLRRGDVLLLCSDGLSGKVQASEMRDCVLTTPTLELACRRMVEIAMHRGGEDNITVVLGEIDGEGLPAAPQGERLTRTLEPVAKFDYLTGKGYAPGKAASPTIPLGSIIPKIPAGGDE